MAGHLSWQGMSMLVQAVAQFGVTAVLAPLLTPEDFGVIAAANIAITFMQVIAEGGVGSAIVQRSDLTPAFISAAMTVALMVGTGCYAVLVICAFPFQAFFAMPGLGVVVLVLGLSSLVSGTCSVLEGLLQRNMGFGSLFRVNLVTSTAGYAVPAIGLALAGAGVWSLVAAALGRVTVKFLMLARLAPMSIRPRWEPSAIRDLARFGFGLTQDRFWLWLSAQAAPFLVGRYFGQAQLGQFYLGSQLAVLPAQYISSVVSAVYFPMVSRALTDKVRVGGQFLAMMVGAFLVMTAFGLVLAINAQFVINMIYGDGWSGAAVVFQVLCVGAGIRACTQICDALNIARGDVYALAGRRAISAVIMVVATYAVRQHGLMEAAWAVTVSHGVMLVMTVALAISGLGLGRAAFSMFIPRSSVSGILLVVVNVTLLVSGRNGMVSGWPLLLASIVANAISLLPIAMGFSAWLGKSAPGREADKLRVGGG